MLYSVWRMAYLEGMVKMQHLIILVLVVYAAILTYIIIKYKLLIIRGDDANITNDR